MIQLFTYGVGAVLLSQCICLGWFSLKSRLNKFQKFVQKKKKNLSSSAAINLRNHDTNHNRWVLIV